MSHIWREVFAGVRLRHGGSVCSRAPPRRTFSNPENLWTQNFWSIIYWIPKTEFKFSLVQTRKKFVLIFNRFDRSFSYPNAVGRVLWIPFSLSILVATNKVHLAVGSRKSTPLAINAEDAARKEILFYSVPAKKRVLFTCADSHRDK